MVKSYQRFGGITLGTKPENARSFFHPISILCSRESQRARDDHESGLRYLRPDQQGQLRLDQRSARPSRIPSRRSSGRCRRERCRGRCASGRGRCEHGRRSQVAAGVRAQAGAAAAARRDRQRTPRARHLHRSDSSLSTTVRRAPDQGTARAGGSGLGDGRGRGLDGAGTSRRSGPRHNGLCVHACRQRRSRTGSIGRHRRAAAVLAGAGNPLRPRDGAPHRSHGQNRPDPRRSPHASATAALR